MPSAFALMWAVPQSEPELADKASGATGLQLIVHDSEVVSLLTVNSSRPSGTQLIYQLPSSPNIGYALPEPIESLYKSFAISTCSRT